MSTVSRILPQRRRSTFGCELRETNPCLLVLVYLISLSFACETSFLGFELDLLTHKVLVSFVCWISTLRNPWYSYYSSIYFSYIDSSSFLSAISYPESLGKWSGSPDTKPGVSGLIPGVFVLSLRLIVLKWFLVADCLFTPL